MGTVGINFGSATSGTGFDVAATVAAIQANTGAIEGPWKSQLAALTAQDTAISTIGTDLATLSSSLQKLTDFAGVTAQKNGASSNPAVLSLTGATSAAIAGSHTITVTTLAQISSGYSGAVTDASHVLSGNIQFSINGVAQPVVTVDSNSNTLATLASKINAAALGVSASVISDVNGSRLSLVSGTSGLAGSLSVTSSLVDTSNHNTAIGFTTHAGVNAQLNVDGLDVVSASNTVSSAIPGVTFQLISTNASPVQVQITNDTASVATAVSTLVTAYNSVLKDIKTQEGKDSSGNPEPLYGSPTLGLLQTQLSLGLLAGSTATYSGGATTAINNLAALGVNFNQDGTLALDSDTLTAALTNNFTGVVGFLQNANSFGSNFTSTLNGLSTTATTGVLHVAQQQNASQEQALNASIKTEDALLAAQKITLTTELNTANQILQGIPQQISQINEIYSAVTGYNKVSA